jgi:hypothetical protein
MLEWLSLATIKVPGHAKPSSIMIWWPMPLPAGKKVMPISAAKAWMRAYLAALASLVSCTL